MAERLSPSEPSRTETAAKRLADLSTGVKVFLILGAVLLPLALISILASAESGRTSAMERGERLMVQLESVAGRLRRGLVEDQASLGASATAQASSQAERGDALCRRLVETIRARHSSRVSFVVADYAGRPICGFRWTGGIPRPAGSEWNSDASGDALTISRRSDTGWTTAARYPVSEIVRMSQPIDLDSRTRLTLLSTFGSLPLIDTLDSSARFFGITNLSIDLTGLELTMVAKTPRLPPTAAQWVSVALPIFMLIGSALIGWLLVHRLFTRQLGFLTRQVELYQPGTIIDLGEEARSGAREVHALGTGLQDLSRLVARNTSEVEAGLERQTALTREVHHRVKNNLQVIASLISLHSRAAEDRVAQEAYRTIQRRVDALSVVHRNHFAGTEVSTGVSLVSLLNELASSLQASSTEDSSELDIVLKTQPALVTQDVATSIAFLVTELAELAIMSGDRLQTLSITAETEAGDRVRLVLETVAFIASPVLESQLETRYGRVLTGLSRQLRAPLEHDGVAGRFTILVPSLPSDPPPEPGTDEVPAR